METRRCAACRWRHETIEAGEAVLTCRRFPPEPYPGAPKKLGVFPVVKPEWACGEWGASAS